MVRERLRQQGRHILALVLRYLSGDAKTDLQSLAEDMDSIQFTYKEYDWSQNFFLKGLRMDLEAMQTS